MVQAISQVDVPVNRPGQRAVAVASSISFVCIFCAFWSWMPSWKDFDRFPGLVCILPFWMPYGFVLLRLYQGRIKSGLVLAGTMGCALFVPGVFLLRFVVEWERSWWIQTNLALALLMQPVLVAAAIWTFRSMQRAPRDLFKMLRSSAYGIVLFGLFWLVYSPVPRLIIYNESMAKYRLRDISGTALQYAEEFDGFYPEGSSLLAPAGRAECDSDHLRYLLRPKDGYIFEYHSVVSETSARGCEVAKTYIITARPVFFRKTGIRSFLVDQSKPGLKWYQVEFIRIHITSEDRPATVSDPGEDIKLFVHRPS
jgi:hypothetical protein